LRESMHIKVMIQNVALYILLSIFPFLACAENYRGWEHLAQQLIKRGLHPKDVQSIYSTRSIPKFDSVYFQLEPGESKRMYREYYRRKKIELAIKQIQTNLTTYEEAYHRFGVTPSLVAAILLVETHYGGYTGNSAILYRLSRLANIDSPNNVEYNFKRHQKTDKKVTRHQVASRANTISKMFVPEVEALIEIAKENRFNPMNIKGSYGGAFGIPQFLPTSYLKYGVDGDKDGSISLYDMDDAIHSTAHFLSRHGWKADLTYEAQKEVIWHYNHSDAYVEAVLHLKQSIEVAFRNRQ